MKQIEISLWELTKEEVIKLPPNVQFLIYNPIMRTYHLEYPGRKCIANSKHALPPLKYFVFDDPSEYLSKLNAGGDSP